MTVNFSQEVSIAEALSKTFDGKHPCPLCKLVRAGKKTESKEEAKIDLKKVDWFSDSICAYDFPKTTRRSCASLTSLSSRADTPASPPPRCFPG